MNEIRMSALFSEIMGGASKEECSGVGPFTAERFVCETIAKLIGTENDPISGEFADAKCVISKATADSYSLMTDLMLYVKESQAKSSFYDELYMKNKIWAASALAKEKGRDKVTVDLLLSCIFDDPSKAIKSALDKAVSPNGEGAKPDDGQLTDEDWADIFDFSEEDGTESFLAKLLADDEKKRKNGETGAAASSEKTLSPQEAKSEISALVSDIGRIRAELGDAVYGQDNAVNVFVTGYFQARMLSMMDKSRKRPRATFLFAGPPGVGKTFLAEKAAEVLKIPFMRFDMSEYADKEANLEFCGSDKVYKNAKQGNVTGFVSENPRCILLFDEIEKAHMCVIHLFLQMLDAGRLRDNYTDEEVSFSDAIIILTTNAGKQLYMESESGDFSSVSRKVIVKALQSDINPSTGAPYFPGAICSRFASGNVVMFNHISAHNLRAIAKKEIERHAGNFERTTGIKFCFDEKVYTALMFSEGGAADARSVRSRAETFFNDELYELLRLIAAEKVETGIDNIEKITVSVDLSRADAKISALFEPAEKIKVLVFADEDAVSACGADGSALEIFGTQDFEKAVEIIKNYEIGFVLADMGCGAQEADLEALNIEDVDSPARDFFRFLRERKHEMPIYILENGSSLSEEERVSFFRQGARGVISRAEGKEKLAEELSGIAFGLHQQASMISLAKENKLISFETAQTVSKDGKNAAIRLFDFRMIIAVESEDTKNVLSSVSTPNVHFSDVIGANDAKKELAYFVEYLKNAKKYTGTGVKAPKGVLLYGPPGTGKTMLARAMACESGVTFIAAEGNQFLKKYVGEGQEKVHELFKTARKYAPSVLFVDEIDAIAKERTGGEFSGARGEETLTAFLTEMDGFSSDPSKPVFVLAATNFDVEPGSGKSLDAALMRRFDRRIYIDLPGKADRIRFMNMKASANHAFAISADEIESIALRSTGMSLAELDSVMEFALRSAIREGSTDVTDAILDEAFETFNGGEVKKWDASQLERVARHEAGHTVVCCAGGEIPSYLTVVARGDHGGYMQHAEQEGKAIYTKDELLAKIRTSLGGRAAEIVYYGENDGISSGASGDLDSATYTAKRIVCTYGMDESVGLASTDIDDASMSAEARAAVGRILREQMEETIRIVSENRNKIDALVGELMVKNHLSGAEIEKIMKD